MLELFWSRETGAVVGLNISGRAVAVAVRDGFGIVVGTEPDTGQVRTRREILTIEERIVGCHGGVGRIEGVVTAHKSGLTARATRLPLTGRFINLGTTHERDTLIQTRLSCRAHIK